MGLVLDPTYVTVRRGTGEAVVPECVHVSMESAMMVKNDHRDTDCVHENHLSSFSPSSS